jgi:hypothetical protein
MLGMLGMVGMSAAGTTREQAAIVAVEPVDRSGWVTWSANWLVSPKYDGFYFLGSCVVTWIFLGLYHGLRAWSSVFRWDSVLLTYFIYTSLFDHPHIFQTFSRTHADSHEFRRRQWTHTVGIALFVAVGYVVWAMHWQVQLVVFSAMFGSWHIVRQHWGLLRMYQTLNGELHALDLWLDRMLFHTGMAACLLYDYSDFQRREVVYGDFVVTFPSVPQPVSRVAWVVFFGTLVCYLGRLGWKVWRREPLNLPKLLLLSAALGTHVMVFRLTSTPFLVAEALETSYHNVQYQGWIRHFQQRRFNRPAIWKRWLTIAMLYGLVVGMIEIAGLVYDLWSWIFVPFAMLILYHYYIEGKIWKLGSDKELRQILLPQRQREANL